MSQLKLQLTERQRSRIQRERDILMYWTYSKAVRTKSLPKSTIESRLMFILTSSPPANQWLYFQLIQLRDLNRMREDNE